MKRFYVGEKLQSWTGHLFVLLRADPGVGVCNSDGQLGSSLNQSFPVLGGDTASDLGAVGLVLHHENLQLLHVVDKNLLEAAGHHVPGLGAATVTNVGHEVHSLELPPNSVVNTLRLPPALRELDITIRLVPDELLSPLLDDLGPGGPC